MNPNYYHLDTALSVLDPVEGLSNGGPQHANIAYLAEAFDAKSLATLEDRFPDAIVVSSEDGAVFGLNSAKMYKYDATKAGLETDAVSTVKAAYLREGADPSLTRYGFVLKG